MTYLVTIPRWKFLIAAGSINGRFLGLIAIAIAFCMSVGCVQEPPAIILEFEIDREALDDETSIDTDRLAAAINMRLPTIGLANVSEDGSIKVHLHGRVEEDELSEIKRRLMTRGLLEFRIMASPLFNHHKEIIDLAKKLPPNENEVWEGESKVAEWVACDIDEFDSYDMNQGIEGQGRFVKRMAGDVLQVLVLTNDGLDVTGEFLDRSVPALDELDRPQINFSFNKQGAFRFGRLTGQHTPDRLGQVCHLGIILDKKLLSAPSIQSKITTHGRITGSMGHQEVEFIAGILNAGNLPYPIRQVSQ